MFNEIVQRNFQRNPKNPMQKQTNQTPFSGAVCGRIRAYSKTLSAVTLALLATAAMNANAADLTWNNGASTGNWNLTDANWTGSVWNNAAPDNAIFDATTFQMGAINLTVPITAGSITVGSASQSDPFTQGSLTGGSLRADSVLVNGNNSGETFGNFNILTFNVPTVSIAGDVSVGLFSTLNISSGNFAASRIIPTPVNNEYVIVTISGSAVVTLTNGLDGGAFANQTFRLNLNAGSTLNTPFIVTSDRFPSVPSIGFLWNSGKVVATGSTNNFIQTFGGFNYDNKIQIGTGAVLDTAGYDIGVGVSMLAVGSGGLTKLGAGTLTLTGTNVAYAGDTVVGGGTLMVADGWQPSAGSQVVISNGFVLNLNFAGSKVVGGLVINGVTLPDGTYNAGNQPANISGTGSLLVTGGPRNMVWNNGAATGNWNTTDANWTGLIWANSRPDNAVFTTVGGSINLTVPITAGSFTFGSSVLNCPNATFSGGSLQLTNNLTVQGNSGNGPRTTAVNMPTFNVGTVTAADVLVGRATLNINSGTWGVNRIIASPISRDWGHTTIGGTAVVTATNGVDGAVGVPNSQAWGMNLDAGGTLYTPYILVADRFAFGANAGAGADFFNWNGGKVVATVDTNGFFSLGGGGGTFFAAVYVGDGGAFFDTAGHNVGFTNNVLQNSVLAGSTGIGGFTKLGAGTLTITGETSWGGDTTVDAGTLVLSFPELAANAGVIINSSAVLQLNFAGSETNTVSRVVIGGVPKPPGVYNASTDPGRITGTGSLLVGPLTLVSATRDYFIQTKVTVVFSTDVNPATATVAANYTIDNGATVGTATMLNATTVVLWASPLSATNVYTLTNNNVQDLVGATIAANSTVPISIPAFVTETVRVPYSLGGTNTVVVLEAEDYNLQIPGTLGYTWEFTTTPVNLLPTATDTNYSGTGVMEAQPYTPNQNIGGSTAGPELEYKVFFPAPASYFVWVRGVGDATSFTTGGTQRSIQTGLDGILLQQISSFPQANGYVWLNLFFGGAIAPTVVTTPGYHKVNAWMRQQGFAFDKLLLTTSASYVPTGFGPAESPIAVSPILITRSGANVVLTWDGLGILQSSTNVATGYTDIVGSFSPWTVAPTGAQKYFRVRE
jgi:autotransporter-associated beta strand protein